MTQCGTWAQHVLRGFGRLPEPPPPRLSPLRDGAAESWPHQGQSEPGMSGVAAPSGAVAFPELVQGTREGQVRGEDIPGHRRVVTEGKQHVQLQKQRHLSTSEGREGSGGPACGSLLPARDVNRGSA